MRKKTKMTEVFLQMLKHFTLFYILTIILICVIFCNGESNNITIEEPLSLSNTSENSLLFNNSEKTENFRISEITSSEIKITIPITQTTTRIPEWCSKVEEARVEAKKRSEERKERVKRFREEYRRWMKLPITERKIEMKKWYAERRKECQNFWCPNFWETETKKGNESDALYWERKERAKIRREKILAQIEEIKNKNKLKALSQTKIYSSTTTIEPIIEETIFTPTTTESLISPITSETTITAEKSEIKITESSIKIPEDQPSTITSISLSNSTTTDSSNIKENKLKINNESSSIIKSTTESKIKETTNIITSSEQPITTINASSSEAQLLLKNKEKNEQQILTNSTDINVYNSTTNINSSNEEQLKNKLEKTKKSQEKKKNEEPILIEKGELEKNIKKEKEEKSEEMSTKENQKLESQTAIALNKIDNEEENVKIKV